jgi:hypothetical protein
MQDVEIDQLKQQVQQLRLSETALQQECKEWQRKHQDQKLEVSQLSGTSSKQGRRIKSIEDRCSDLEVQLADRASEATRLREHLSKAQERIRQAELQTETSEQVSSRRSAAAEFDLVRSQLIDLQQEHSKLQHAHKNCAHSAQQAADKFTDAARLQRTAQAEMEACRHLEEANRLTQDHSLLVQKQLLEVTRKLRINEANVSELEKAVEIHRADKMNAEDRVAELEADLRKWKPQADHHDPNLDALPSSSSSYSSSGKDVSDASTAPASGLIVPDTGLTANITININPADQNNLTLLQRVQSAVSRASKLDVTGPQDLVADFLAEMKRLEADHAEQTTAAAHWQKVALKCLAEVDSLSATLQNRPVCCVPGHRALVDELEAKDLQLQLQATLVAQWQKKIEAARGYFETSNAEMRESGMQGVWFL